MRVEWVRVCCSRVLREIDLSVVPLLVHMLVEDEPSQLQAKIDTHQTPTECESVKQGIGSLSPSKLRSIVSSQSRMTADMTSNAG